MVQFLHGLRGLLRSSIAACIITFPAHLHSPETVKKVENLVDYIVRLESFDGKVLAGNKLNKRDWRESA
jgi:elongator complex protein 4